jgi:hypothetical protein
MGKCHPVSDRREPEERRCRRPGRGAAAEARAPTYGLYSARAANALATTLSETL